MDDRRDDGGVVSGTGTTTVPEVEAVNEVSEGEVPETAAVPETAVPLTAVSVAVDEAALLIAVDEALVSMAMLETLLSEIVDVPDKADEVVADAFSVVVACEPDTIPLDETEVFVTSEVVI